MTDSQEPHPTPPFNLSLQRASHQSKSPYRQSDDQLLSPDEKPTLNQVARRMRQPKRAITLGIVGVLSIVVVLTLLYLSMPRNHHLPSTAQAISGTGTTTPTVPLPTATQLPTATTIPTLAPGVVPTASKSTPKPKSTTPPAATVTPTSTGCIQTVWSEIKRSAPNTAGGFTEYAVAQGLYDAGDHRVWCGSIRAVNDLVVPPSTTNTMTSGARLIPDGASQVYNGWSVPANQSSTSQEETFSGSSYSARCGFIDDSFDTGMAGIGNNGSLTAGVGHVCA